MIHVYKLSQPFSVMAKGRCFKANLTVEQLGVRIEAVLQVGNEFQPTEEVELPHFTVKVLLAVDSNTNSKHPLSGQELYVVHKNDSDYGAACTEAAAMREMAKRIM